VVKDASSYHPHALNIVEIEAWETQNIFLENFFKESQWEINKVEEMVKLKKNQTLG
jgi:hypothetical protein